MKFEPQEAKFDLRIQRIAICVLFIIIAIVVSVISKENALKRFYFDRHGHESTATFISRCIHGEPCALPKPRRSQAVYSIEYTDQNAKRIKRSVVLPVNIFKLRRGERPSFPQSMEILHDGDINGPLLTKTTFIAIKFDRDIFIGCILIILVFSALTIWLILRLNQAYKRAKYY